MKLEWIRTGIAIALIATGLFIFFVATLGLYRLHYVLNRMHAAAKCDTLGTLLVLSGVIVLLGFSYASLKIIVLIIFVWLANPVAVHLIGKVEVKTNPYLKKDCEIVEYDNI